MRTSIYLLQSFRKWQKVRQRSWSAIAHRLIHERSNQWVRTAEPPREQWRHPDRGNQLSKFGQATKWRLTAIGVLIPLAVVALALIWQDYNLRREATLIQLELQSAQINEQLESFVGKTEGISQQIASHFSMVFPSVQLSRSGVVLEDDANAYLSNIVAQNDSYSRAIVVDRDGKAVGLGTVELAIAHINACPGR